MTGETCVECAQAGPSCPASPGSPLTWGLYVLSIEEILADSEDEDSEQEERSRGKEQRKLTRQRSRAWLKEGGGDEPLNFLDPKVAQRVLGEQEAAGMADFHVGPWAPLTRTHAHRCASDTRPGHRAGLGGHDEGVSGLGLAFHLTARLCHASHTAWAWLRQEEGPWLQSEC